MRQLFALSGQVSQRVFAQALGRALRYRILRIDTLQRIVWLCMSQDGARLPEAEVDESFRDRPAYQEGYLTDEPDLTQYDRTPEEDDTPF